MAMAGNIDIVADVLKRLGTKQDISQNEIKRAKESYSKTIKELKYLKDLNPTAMSNSTVHGEKPSEHPGDGQSKEKKQDIQALMERNAKMREELDTSKRKIQELLTRLSSLAGQKLSDSNPEITDLSDPNRPTVLADHFHQVYDNEWTQLYEEMTSFEEVKKIEAIIHIVKEVDKFCTKAQAYLLEKLQSYIIDDFENPKLLHPKGEGLVVGGTYTFSETEKRVVLKQLKDLRKVHAKVSVKGLIGIFKQVHVRSIKKKCQVKSSKELDEFVSKCVELLWLMEVQDPPMQLIWAEPGHRVDKDRFTFYTKRGEVVQHNIWPAVLLHKDGPLMSKGVVQGK